MIHRSTNNESASGQTMHSENRLQHAVSPYLLQHASNPVAWQPWDDAALEQARRENKPIFLSIGYAACHWCHVMEHESFEDAAIAALMNRYFVNIKVDREERPDLDALYMKAVVAMTGQGGWPMSVFLTPERAPFYGGTYFPPERRYGMPAFRDVLEQIASRWHENRDSVETHAARVVSVLQQHAPASTKSIEDFHRGLFEDAEQALADAFDARWGGWDGAPKFPAGAALALLLCLHHRNNAAGTLSMVTTTLDRMRQGGIYDQLGGGFHRYSVDEEWRVPHFEKMLYDNARLAVVYLEAWQHTGISDYRTVAGETLDYLLRDMQDPLGGFYASQDADSEGDEGAFYLWTRDEIMQHLGKEAGALFCESHDVRQRGNFVSQESGHHGKNVLALKKDAPNLAPLRKTLLEARYRRVPPQTDDKILTSWNALAITAFAKAAFALETERYCNAALKGGAFLRDVMFQGDTLLRAWRNGKAHLPGYLDDYACTVNAFIDLYECSADYHWLEVARTLASLMIDKFHNQAGGAFYGTSAEHKHLVARLQPLHDAPEPSGNAEAALALLRLGVLFNEERYTTLARETLSAAAHVMRDAPAMSTNLLLAADLLYRGSVEITLAGDDKHPTMKAFLRVIGETYIPHRVLAYAGDEPERLGLAAVRPSEKALETPSAQVCKDHVCLPVAVAPEDLSGQLTQ